MSAKRKFNMVPHLSRLIASIYDADQVVNAVQAEIGKAVSVEDKNTASAVTIRQNKKDGSFSQWRESDGHVFRGPDNGPMKFAAYADGLRELFSAHGEPSGELTDDILPAGQVIWLAKFPKVKPATDGKPDEATKSNGKRGGMKSAPTPAPAV
jgi:hypothetical protein